MAELNEYLIPADSPFAQGTTDIVNTYQFDANNERGVISSIFIQDATVTNAKITSVSADKITAGTITVGINLGNPSAGTITIDGANNRIVIHDGTTNRIVIGEV